jgi:hypothetical protein
MARFLEDISWSTMYKDLITLYDKSPIVWRVPSENTVYVPNVGRESYAFLKHIVDRYDSLANLTIFTQANKPTFGYSGGHYNGHMSPGYSFHDFVLAESDGFFIFNHALKLDTFEHLVRPVGTHWQRWWRMKSPQSRVCSLPRGGQRFLIHAHLKRLGALCSSQTAAHCHADAFWRRYVRLPPPPLDEMYHFAQGARLAVTRSQIQRRPRKEYEEMLNLVSSTDDAWAGYFFEWFFFPILTSEADPCTTTRKYRVHGDFI